MGARLDAVGWSTNSDAPWTSLTVHTLGVTEALKVAKPIPLEGAVSTAAAANELPTSVSNSGDVQ